MNTTAMSRIERYPATTDTLLERFRRTVSQWGLRYNLFHTTKRSKSQTTPVSCWNVKSNPNETSRQLLWRKVSLPASHEMYRVKSNDRGVTSMTIALLWCIDLQPFVVLERTWHLQNVVAFKWNHGCCTLIDDIFKKKGKTGETFMPCRRLTPLLTFGHRRIRPFSHDAHRPE